MSHQLQLLDFQRTHTKDISKKNDEFLLDLRQALRASASRALQERHLRPAQGVSRERTQKYSSARVVTTGACKIFIKQ